MKMHLLAVATLLSLTSCATIHHGKYQQVAFTSDPEGANVYFDQQFVGTTPLLASLRRSDCCLVRIELDGYKPYNVQLTPTVSGWVFGNLVFGGLIGIAIDATNGSMYKLTPGELNACLESADGNVISHTKQEECEVVILSTVDPTWEKLDTLERE